MTKHLSEGERREQILDAARQVFVEQGYSAARMEDIARRANLSKGGIYFHFKSKRELFEALVASEYEISMSFLSAVSLGEGSVREKLLALGRYYPGYFSSHPDSARLSVVMAEVAIRDDQIRADLVQVHQTYIDVLSKVIDSGVQSGELRPVDATAIAVLLKALANGLEFSYALGYEPPIEEVLGSGLGALLRGMASDP